MTIRDLKEQLETLIEAGTPESADVWVEIEPESELSERLVTQIRKPIAVNEGRAYIVLRTF